MDERTLVSDLTHRLLDLAWEDYRVNVLAEEPRGSTGRGITPAYLDEVGQWQITFSDFLAGPNYFARKLAQRCRPRAEHHPARLPRQGGDVWDVLRETHRSRTARQRRGIELGVFSKEEFDFNRFRGASPFSLNLEAPHRRVLAGRHRAGARTSAKSANSSSASSAAGRTVIGEFGQSYWLDKRHGYSPNVTASHTFAPRSSSRAPASRCSASTPSASPRPTTPRSARIPSSRQMDENHPLTVKLKQLEFGTSTGRQRMVGWFDAVEKGDVLRYGGFQDLMINKADALTHSGEWKGDLLICHRLRGCGRTTLLPRSQE
jgi:adenylosuccinate synthase